MRWVTPTVIAITLASGCGGPATPPNPAAIEVRPTEYDARSMVQVELGDGEQVDLIRPPQGGFVLFIGAYLRNVNDPTVELLGRVLDGAGTELTRDTRTVTLQPAAGDPATLTPDLRSYINVSNIAVCPAATTTDRFGQPFVLEVKVTERSTGRSGSGRRNVTLACRQTDPTQLKLCQCECAANYVLGKCTQ